MVRPILYVHWKQIRLALVPFIIASFGLPLMVVQGLGTPSGMATTGLSAYQILGAAGGWLPIFPILAGAIGITLALSAWNWDHQLNHVYALSLPVTRGEYSLAKLGAGMLLALLPAAAMLIGANVAAASISLPAGLNAYPNELALRFLMAILLSYSLAFALAAGTMRTTIYVLTGVLAFFVFGTAIDELLASQIGFFAQYNVVEEVVMFLAEAGGPFEVFNGSWSLIDV